MSDDPSRYYRRSIHELRGLVNQALEDVDRNANSSADVRVAFSQLLAAIAGQLDRIATALESQR